jgi:hypothetical protein
MAPLPKGEPHAVRARVLRAAVAALLFAACLAVLALVPTRSAGQAGGEDGVYYTKSKAFNIPFRPEAGNRRIVKVELYVSRDSGRSWSRVAVNNPNDGYFRFEARDEGWFYFAPRTIDQDNRAYPANLDQLQPTIKVCVDSTPPEVALKASQPRDGKVGVEWSVIDDNLDVNTLRLDYRVAGGSWQELPAQKAASGERLWVPNSTSAMEVRLRVQDRAGNLGEKTVSVSANGDKPLPDSRPRPGDSGPGPSNDTTTSGIRFVNTNRISFNFKIEDVGTSGVSAVELWYTEDQGRSWRKHPEALGNQPPYVITVEGEKLYGFTLIAKSGVGKGEEPPRKGDQPQVYVQVDKTKPEVHLDSAKVASGYEGNTLTISWSARDQFIRPQPITISYCERLGDDWKPIARDLENTGKYVWKLPSDVPPRMYVRVEAIDRAGNIGSDETKEEVIVDLKVPRVINIGVEGSK